MGFESAALALLQKAGAYEGLATTASSAYRPLLAAGLWLKSSISSIASADSDRVLPAVKLLYEAKPQLGNLVESLAPDIKEGRWQSIIGDDLSGRPVAKLIRNLAKLWHEENQLGPAPLLQYLAAGSVKSRLDFDSFQNGWNIRERLRETKTRIDLGRALIVTEHIATGDSINRLAGALKGNGIRFDVASVYSSSAKLSNLWSYNIDSDVRLYTGTLDKSFSDRNPLHQGGHPQLRRVMGFEKSGNNATSKVSSDADPQELYQFQVALRELSRDFYRQYISNHKLK